MSADVNAFITAGERFLDAMEGGDVAGIAEIVEEYVHPDCVFTSAIGSEVEGRPYLGRAGVTQWFSEFLEVMSTAYEDREWRSADDAVLVLTRQTFTGRASGAATRREIGVIWELDDGLARRIRSFPSHEDALEAWEEITG